MKYKIAGTLNVLFGIFQVIVMGMFFLVTAPKLSRLYEMTGSGNEGGSWTYPALGIALGVTNVFFGLVNLNVVLKGRKEKYFVLSIIYFLMSFFLMGLISALSAVDTVDPLYKLSSL